MKTTDLHVVCAYSNPMRWNSRQRLYRDFEKHMLDSGVQLHTVELAHGHRPFEVSEGPHHNPAVDYIQVRAKTMLWHKENLLNIGLRHVPSHARYIGWFDADITFSARDWPLRVIQELQHHPVIQPWSDAIDLGPKGTINKHSKSFANQWMAGASILGVQGEHPYTYGHPGFAWAATRDFLNATGGLIERAILGNGDHHMATAIVGKGEASIKKGATNAYRDMVMDWQSLALSAGNGNLGVCNDTEITHHFHGHKENRFYVSRWDIILRDSFDPQRDLVKNLEGVLELRGNKPRLQRDIIRYFWSRREDDAVL